MAYGHALTAEDYAKAAQVIHQTGRAAATTWDLMLTPRPARTAQYRGLARYILEFRGLQGPVFRVLGSHQPAERNGPASDLRTALLERGGPADRGAVRHSAQFGDELTLLRLARQLEEAAPCSIGMPEQSTDSAFGCLSSG